jgi:hypothetical protein
VERTGEPSPKSGAGSLTAKISCKPGDHLRQVPVLGLQVDVKVRLEALADDAFERSEIDCLITIGVQGELFSWLV